MVLKESRSESHYQYFYLLSLCQEFNMWVCCCYYFSKLVWKFHYNDLSQHPKNEPNFSFRLPTRSGEKATYFCFFFLPFASSIASHCLSLYHRLPRFYRYGVLENLSKDFGKVEKVFLRKDSQKTTRRKKKGRKLRMTRESRAARTAELMMMMTTIE